MPDDTQERRHIAIEGASNFRDFGGYPSADGGVVIRGHLFRSAHLAGVTANGAAVLADLGIATIIDLRGVEERARAPSTFVSGNGVRIVSTPVEPGTALKLRLLDERDALDGASVRTLMIDGYRRYAIEEAPSFGRALAAIAEASDAPLVVHCTAGKDRTGFLVAIIQSLLGVDRDSVYADYVATNRYWDRLSASQAGRSLPDTAREALFAADPAYLDAAFAAIAQRYGSVEDFARQALAGDGLAVEQLVANLRRVADAASAASKRSSTPMPR
ncbi:MAG: tyrosine-protein phosphatase [Hyphomicrobiales bacterium]